MSGLVLAAEKPEADLVYIGSNQEGIYSSWLNVKTGALTEPHREVALNGTGFLVMRPDHQRLYATGVDSQKKAIVVAFSIGEKGALTEMNRQDARGKRLCHVSLDACTKVLMAANYGEGNVTSYLLNQDGGIAPLVSLQQHQGASANPKRQTGPHAHSISGQLTLSSEVSLPPGSGPRHLKFSKNGKLAYVLNELSVNITVFDRNSKTGTLTSRQTISVLDEAVDQKQMTCSEIQVSKDGRFAYCATRDLRMSGRDTLTVLAVKAAENGFLWQDKKLTMCQFLV